jgi:hypothetical protein
MIAIALENEMKDRTKRQFFNIFIEKMRDKYCGLQKKGGREKLVRVTGAEEIVIYSAKVN